VSVRTVVSMARLVRRAFMRVMVVNLMSVVRRRVTMAVTRVDGRAWAGRVGAVGDRVAAKEAHVAQRT